MFNCCSLLGSVRMFCFGLIDVSLPVNSVVVCVFLCLLCVYLFVVVFWVACIVFDCCGLLLLFALWVLLFGAPDCEFLCFVVCNLVLGVGFGLLLWLCS